MPPPSVVHVQPVDNWLANNWQSILFSSLLALLPSLFILWKWKQAQRRQQALYNYSLAETLRKQGNVRNSIQLYDRILQQDCPEPLVWRCHAGRSMALLARGDAAMALQDAAKALQQAKEQQQKQAAQQQQKQQQLQARATAAASPTNEDSTQPGAVPATPAPAARSFSDSYTSDPFLSAPISLSLLHYQRGLIHESLGSHASALADWRTAIQLEPDFSFVPSYVERRELEEKMQQGMTANAKRKAVAAHK